MQTQWPIWPREHIVNNLFRLIGSFLHLRPFGLYFITTPLSWAPWAISNYYTNKTPFRSRKEKKGQTTSEKWLNLNLPTLIKRMHIQMPIGIISPWKFSNDDNLVLRTITASSCFFRVIVNWDLWPEDAIITNISVNANRQVSHQVFSKIWSKPQNQQKGNFCSILILGGLI